MAAGRMMVIKIQNNEVFTVEYFNKALVPYQKEPILMMCNFGAINVTLVRVTFLNKISVMTN